MRSLPRVRAGLCLALFLVASIVNTRPALAAADEVTPSSTLLLRLFLTDGSSLVSYGEPARIGDRVVFSLPTSDAVDDPQLHLVNIPAERVDWERTGEYAESARAATYIAQHGDRQYALLTAGIGQVLNEVASTESPAGRLAIVERARRTLAEWPGRHYNYKAAEIRDLLEILDEAIADLRAAVGLASFDLSFVAPSPARPEPVPLLPMPTPRETIEQTLVAARLTESPAERMSLMSVALRRLTTDADRLPSDWRTYTRTAIETVLATERRIDLQYRTLTTKILGRAAAGARAADVRGLERLLTEIQRQDQALGGRRPDTVRGLVSTVEERLDAARRLSLARERWSLRLPELRTFEAAVVGSANRLNRLRPALEDIRVMAVSAPDALALVERTASQVLEIVAPLAPPDELRAAHSLFVSAAQLATSAARIRREAALSGDLSRAWDASSAAAGALMLAERARRELDSALSRPQLAQ